MPLTAPSQRGINIADKLSTALGTAFNNLKWSQTGEAEAVCIRDRSFSADMLRATILTLNIAKPSSVVITNEDVTVSDIDLVKLGSCFQYAAWAEKRVPLTQSKTSEAIPIRQWVNEIP